MLYLNKLLCKVKENPTFFKSTNLILEMGLSSTQIKDLKRNAIEKQFITQVKQEYYLTPRGEEYLLNNPLEKWQCSEFIMRPDVNVEYLKEEKIPSILTKAIRAFARHLIDAQELKKNSLEFALSVDLKKCKNFSEKLKEDLLDGCGKKLSDIYEKYIKMGFTKSLVSLVILDIIVKNIEKIAIYEKGQFQLRMDTLMFDRIMACPENFEIKKTELNDEYILKDISKIILNRKSNNILEITKGLIATIRSLDKYTMNTENLTQKTLRLRNVIVNAKDPISLFERDIPKALGCNHLKDADREFLNNLKKSLYELKNSTEDLISDLREFIFTTFKSKDKEELAKRFLAIKDYIAKKELKILSNSIVDVNVAEDLWINRIATFINKSRVPKDWNDEDYADFKVKTKELALTFFVLESIVGTSEAVVSKKFNVVLNDFLKLSKPEQSIFLRKIINR